MKSRSIMMKESRIVEVTVFPESAMVTRSADSELKPGENSIVFTALPMGIQRESIRVSIDGDSGAKIDGVNISEEYLDSPEEENIEKLEVELEEIRNSLSAVDAEIISCSSKTRLLTSIMEHSFARFMDEFYYKKRTFTQPKQAAALYLQNSEKIDAELIQLKKKKNGLEKDIIKTENQLSAMAGLRNLETVNCNVVINSKKAVSCRVYLKYLVDNAGWEPVYDARLMVEKMSLEISYYGTISQNSGENWNDVKIILSSNIPSASQELPEPETWFIGTSVDHTYSYPGSTGVEGTGRGVNAEFRIKEIQSIPADGTEKKVLVSSEEFPVGIEYQSYPSAVESVYMKGKFTNSAEYPMLPGKVKVYHDRDYIGDSILKAVVQGEETELSLGIDDTVRIKREMLKDFTGKKGITGGHTRKAYRYSITVENFKKEKLSIKVMENIPVSRNSEVKVELNETTGGSDPDHRGVIRWEITIKPEEKKNLLIDYHIEHPVNSMVTGL